MLKEKQTTLKSLSKALNILKLFLDKRDELTLGEISKLSGLDKTTTGRILSTLVKHGYIKQKEKRGKYFLGTIFVNFSGVVKSKIQLRNIAIPYLTKLSQKVGEQVMLACGNNWEESVMESIYDTSQSNSILRISETERTGIPPHCTAIGKIYLANLSEGELKEYLTKEDLVRYTSKTITNEDDLRDQLARVRQEGIAYDGNEYSLGVSGIAVGLRDSEGKLVGCIGVLAPSVRLTRAKIRELEPEIVNCASEISQEIYLASGSGTIRT